MYLNIEKWVLGFFFFLIKPSNYCVVLNIYVDVCLSKLVLHVQCKPPSAQDHCYRNSSLLTSFLYSSEFLSFQ